MPPLAQLVQQLRQSGIPPEQIPQVIQRLAQEAARKRAALLGSGFPQSYVSGLSGPDLFEAGGLPLLTGQNEVDRELQSRIAAESALGGRASTGLSYLDMLRSIDSDLRERERDPFQLAQHLADVSGLSRDSAASPIQALIGEGRFIQPRLPSYLQGDDFRRVQDSVRDYSAPRTFQSEEREDPNIARVRRLRETMGDDAVNDIFRRFAEYDRNRGVQAYAGGGTMMTDEPMMGIGMMSQRPRFMVGEEGPEMLSPGRRMGSMDITPMSGMRRFADGGTVRAGSVPTGIGAALRKRFEGLDASDARAREMARKAAALGGVSAGTPLNTPGGVVIDGVRYAGSGTAGSQAGSYQRNADRIRRQNEQFRQGYASWQPGTEAGNRAGRRGDARRAAQAGGGQPLSRFPVEGRRGTSRNDLDPNDPLGRGIGNRPVNRTPVTRTVEGAQGLEPRQAAAMALGRALQNNPFAPRELIAELMSGRLGSPGNMTGRFLNNVSPTVRDALMGLAPNFGFRMEDYASDIERYRIPEFRFAGRAFA